AGLFARTSMAQRFMGELESAVLAKVPAYDYLKQAGASVMGLGEMAEHPLVLAQIGDAWRIGVQTDAAEDDLVAVFIPNSPNPFTGSLFLMRRDKVQPAQVPLAAAIGCLRRCGVGAGPIMRTLSEGRSDVLTRQS
ncbi:MAG: DUF502 domain-containing protein, partial [Hyphomicrobiales bacterium]|nr:DUF502 domain-containing protein [Hyphomicrobiales bacterium]